MQPHCVAKFINMYQYSNVKGHNVCLFRLIKKKVVLADLGCEVRKSRYPFSFGVFRDRPQVLCIFRKLDDRAIINRAE